MLWQGLPFKNVNAQSQEREWRKDGERKKRGSRKKEKNLGRVSKRVGLNFCDACICQPQTHKEWDLRRKRGRDGEEAGGSRGAYENGRGWRQSLIRRELWVSAVVGNGSSCLGGGLNNTVCLSRVVGLAGFTASIVSICDDTVDRLTGHFIFYFCSELSTTQIQRDLNFWFPNCQQDKMGDKIHSPCSV